MQMMAPSAGLGLVCSGLIPLLMHVLDGVLRSCADHLIAVMQECYRLSLDLVLSGEDPSSEDGQRLRKVVNALYQARHIAQPQIKSPGVKALTTVARARPFSL